MTTQDDPTSISSNGGPITIDPTTVGEVEHILTVIDKIGCTDKQRVAIEVVKPTVLAAQTLDNVHWPPGEGTIVLTTKGSVATAAVMMYDLNGRMVASSTCPT